MAKEKGFIDGSHQGEVFFVVRRCFFCEEALVVDRGRGQGGRFMKLVKFKKRGKITLSFISPDFFKKKICYQVFAKQKKNLRAGIYYRRCESAWVAKEKGF